MEKFRILDDNFRNGFKNLARVANEYRGEEKTVSNRFNEFGDIHADLIKALEIAEAYQAETAKSPIPDPERESEQIRLNQAVIELRKWLSRQGVWFTSGSGIRDDKNMELKVAYDGELAQQGATALKITGGKLCYAATGALLDTSKMTTFFTGPGAGIYVLSASGTFHVHSHSVGQYHHSSLLASAPVACAGEIKVKDGTILWLSNKSGHYWPSFNNFLTVLATLQNADVDLGFGVSCYFDANKLVSYPTINDMMIDKQLDNLSIEKLKWNVKHINKCRSKIRIGLRGWRQPANSIGRSNNIIIGNRPFDRYK